MKEIASKIHGVLKRRIDVVRSFFYTRKWSAGHGKFVVARKTRIEAGKKNLMIDGNVHIGCPKGAFGHIGIPGVDSTLIRVDGDGKLHLREDVYVYAGSRIIVAGQGSVEIGRNTSIAANTYILSRSQIIIGNDCAISWGCQIMDSDFHEIWDEDSEQIKDTSVVIGNHVLVCSKVTILKGVKIGNNVIIAANSVVTRDVPNGCVAAGNPAQIIKKNVHWT